MYSQQIKRNGGTANPSYVADKQSADMLQSLISSAKKEARYRYEERQQWPGAGKRDDVEIYRRIGISPELSETEKDAS